MAQATEGTAHEDSMLGSDWVEVPEVARPGGDALSAQLLEGVGADASARLVHLAPGFGETVRLVDEIGPRSYTCVVPTPAAARALARVAPAVETVVAPLSATGLEQGSASAVIAEGLLTRTPVGERAAVLAEAARLLRAGGRLGLHELCLWPGDDPRAARAAAMELSAVGLHPVDLDGWQSSLAAAGLVPVGSVTGPIVGRGASEIVSERGMRGALATLESLGRDRAAARRLAAARSAVAARVDHLAGVVLVGERPLIAGIRRPSSP